MLKNARHQCGNVVWNDLGHVKYHLLLYFVSLKVGTFHYSTQHQRRSAMSTNNNTIKADESPFFSNGRDVGRDWERVAHHCLGGMQQTQDDLGGFPDGN